MSCDVLAQAHVYIDGADGGDENTSLVCTRSGTGKKATSAELNDRRKTTTGILRAERKNNLLGFS